MIILYFNIYNMMNISLRKYGYSTKDDNGERMDSIHHAICKNDVQDVYQRLRKLGEFNPIMKEDAESVARIYELNCVEASMESEEPKTGSMDLSVFLRNYGYFTKKEYNERLDAVERAIEEYGVQAVYERLVKLGELNPAMKEDAESIARIYDLSNMDNESVDVNEDETTTEVVNQVFTEYREKSKKDKEKKELFLEMLDVKLKNYNRELSNMLDDDDTNFLFDKLRESVITAYDEKIKKDKKIMDEAVLKFTKAECVFDNYRTKMSSLYRENTYFYENMSNLLKEMKNEEIMQNILAKIFEILHEHKNCKLVNISEIEKEQQKCMDETRNIFNQIKELIETKSINRSNDDIEGYVITTNCIVSLYNKVFPKFLNSLIYEERLRNIKNAIETIPCAKDFE